MMTFDKDKAKEIKLRVEADRSSQKKLKIIPLGGLGEYGKNMMIYEYGDDIIIVDCGVMFPEAEMLGVDFVIADITYLLDKRKNIRGIIFTHGHEDHIGGVPYIWPRLNCPMFASPLTKGLIEVKLEEFGIKDAKINVFEKGEKIKLGVFEIEAIQLAHSIPNALALAINSPVGLFLHVTDWKFDHTPIFHETTDSARLAELGKAGVKCLLSDSSNANVPGYTISERVLSDTFDNIFKNAKGRIVITTFASLINRIQQAFDAAIKYRRKVAISGRSMENNVNMAMRLGYLRIPEGALVDIRKVNQLPADQVAILCTGSQGEEFSALSRMASGEHRQIKIKRGDTVIISSSSIPGNEASIHATIDSLFKEGANVIYGKSVDIHVSGHAAQEELKMLLALTSPECFVPIHGEYRHMVAHADLAEKMGVKRDKIKVIEDGQVLEFDQSGVEISKKRVQSSYILVDGLGVGDVGNIVLRDRQAMAKDGIFVVILTVDHKTGKILTSPDIISRGFVYMRAAEDLIYRARQEVKNMFARHNEKYPMNWDYVRKEVREEMGEFLYKNTQRRPMVIPVIIEV